MIKNLFIAGLATGWIINASPYTFHGVELASTIIGGVVLITALMNMADRTIYEHISYKKRRKFRRLLDLTTIK